MMDHIVDFQPVQRRCHTLKFHPIHQNWPNSFYDEHVLKWVVCVCVVCVWGGGIFLIPIAKSFNLNRRTNFLKIFVIFLNIKKFYIHTSLSNFHGW
jgi:hypothetical protein